MRLSAVLAASLLGTLLALPGAAQESDAQAQPDQESAYFDVVDVEIVNIDVWVSDKDGMPVTGLGRDDFRILRDGVPISIDNFYAVVDGRSAGDAVEVAPIEETALPIDSPREASLPEDQQLWLVLYIDNFNIDPIDRNRILPAVRNFLGRTVRPDDQVMLITYDRSLEVRRPFTDDTNLLYEALDEIESESGLAVVRQRDRKDVLKRIDDSRDPRRALLYARQFAEEIMNTNEYSVEAMERLLDTLAGLPGRKALLHVSSGIPMSAGEELFQIIGDRWTMSEAYGEIPRHSTHRIFERLNRLAAAHRVVFYTLDAAGLRGLQFGAAEYGTFLTPRMRSTLDSVVPQNLQSSLRLMALETGGRAILNQNEVLPALIEASRDFRTYYALGISATGVDSGSHHQVKVSLRDGLPKDYKVRHRTGYRSKNMDTRMRESLRSALLYEHETNPLGLEITWGKPQPQANGKKFLMPIQLRIPLRDLVILPLGEKHELSLELFVGAADESGALSEIDKAPIGLRLAEEHVEAARGEALLHTHKLLLTPGKKKIGVALLDRFGRETSVVTNFVHVGTR